MLMKKPNYRKFNYEPRHYNPETDETEKRKRNLKFRYARKSKDASGKMPLILLAAFIVILIIYLVMEGAF